MMGTKERNFQPLPNDLSLEDLVPEDNFYRRLQQKLDLSFVRELVEDLQWDGFPDYLEDVLLPTLKRGQVVVMDNLSAHKGQRVRELIEAKGCELVYLLPP